MRVSYVIPSFNQGRYIKRCIESCLAQEVEAFEIIVMDGGSTDETVDVLKSFGDQITWVSEKDDGQADAVNKGVERATGEIIAWVNSDDFYAAGALQAVVDVFESQPAVGLVHGRGSLVTADGKPWRPVMTGPVTSAADLLAKPGNYIFQPTVFFRRSLFMEVGKLDPSLHYAMDMDLWLGMLPKTQWRFIDKELAFATTHTDAKSRAKLKECFQQIESCKRRHAPMLNLSPMQHLRWRCGRLRQSLYALLVRLGIKQLPGD